MPLIRRTALACALVTGSGVLGAGLGQPQPAVAASAQVFQVPPNGVFALTGHGWGHGHGLSQYGAYGAAKVDGMTYRQILAFYYPDTTPTGLPLGSPVRVVLHDTMAGQLPVAPRGGAKLTVTTTADGVPPCILPDSVDGGKTSVAQWRARVITTSDGERMRVQASTDGNTWNTDPTITDCDPAWSKPLDGSVTFDGGGITDLVRGGAIAPYRGNLRAAFTGTRIYVVNIVPIDQYLRSVVPSEMPSSWAPAALQSQAVAARTYAAYEIAHPKNKPYYDMYDDTRDQMYIGQSHEAASTTAAVMATEDPDAQTGDILTSNGGPAFTQFSSSNGGWTVYGGQPYLPAQKDPYDGLVPSSVHDWSTTVPATTIAKLYGKQIGQLQSIAVTGRDGHGQWGGRVTSLDLRGSSGTVTVTGTDFRLALGLRSEWFTVVPPPAPPTEVTADVSGGAATVGWQPPPASGSAAVTGYKVVMQPGGASITVNAKTRTATIDGLDPATDYTASVTALSSVGPGWSSTVTTKVHRLEGGSGVALAVAASQATFADGEAQAVVLVRKSTAVPYGFAAAPLSNATHAATLLTAQTSLPAATATELQRVLPSGGTVYLLGPASV
ncbi:MAG TPA: SpoIID/LytB domain-containing protein, partial [Amycolatopsis sp.]|nr:SpoIID/LytB domain-containing protein [Amycolatopsis sp.]